MSIPVSAVLTIVNAITISEERVHPASMLYQKLIRNQTLKRNIINMKKISVNCFIFYS